MSADFSGVKIHTGNEASEMSSSINAKAFTSGQDIYFGQGEYDTNSKQGKELIAHELVHTKQQGEGLTRKIQRKTDWDPNNPIIKDAKIFSIDWRDQSMIRAQEEQKLLLSNWLEYLARTEGDYYISVVWDNVVGNAINLVGLTADVLTASYIVAASEIGAAIGLTGGPLTACNRRYSRFID